MALARASTARTVERPVSYVPLSPGIQSRVCTDRENKTGTILPESATKHISLSPADVHSLLRHDLEVVHAPDSRGSFRRGLVHEQPHPEQQPSARRLPLAPGLQRIPPRVWATMGLRQFRIEMYGSYSCSHSQEKSVTMGCFLALIQHGSVVNTFIRNQERRGVHSVRRVNPELHRVITRPRVSQPKNS